MSIQARYTSTWDFLLRISNVNKTQFRQFSDEIIFTSYKTLNTVLMS